MNTARTGVRHMHAGEYHDFILFLGEECNIFKMFNNGAIYIHIFYGITNGCDNVQ